MQINNDLSLSNLSGSVAADRTAPGQSRNAQSFGGDQVQISSLATQMANDPSKLSQLEASYEAGTYNVSPAQIANSILNDAMI